MDFLSIKFFIFLFSALFIVYFSPLRYRISVVFPLLNLFFILTYVNDLSQLLPLVVFLCAGFLGIRLVGTFTNRAALIASLSVILVIFIYLKKYAFISFLPFISWPYLSIGLSYILFRMVQMLIDVYQQLIEEKVSLLSFFNFCCNFLTFVSGPIQRYEDFKLQESSLGQKALTEREVFDSFSRMIHGFFKVVVLSTLCLNYFQWFDSFLQSSTFNESSLVLCRKFILANFFYVLYFYFNFTGYMDIVISFGRLLGFELPENFDRPFESRSFLEFWSRWHITLSEWFKYYLFNPFVRFLTNKWPNRKIIAYHGVIAYFFVFFMMGVWHGSSWLFLIYGIFLGAGMSLNKLFDVLMHKYFSVQYKKMIGHRFSGLLGAAFTFSYWSIGISCFWMDFNGFVKLMAIFKIKGLLISFLLGGFLWAAAISFVLGFKHITARTASLLFGNFYSSRIWLSFELFVVITYWFYGFGGIPDFVYKSF